jgi:hypothetical protein
MVFLSDEIHAGLPFARRQLDSLRGGALSRGLASRVGSARIMEHDARMRVARGGWELQAALEARAEQIAAPPPMLEQDLDGLAYAACGVASSSPIQESKDPQGYELWVEEWVRSSEAVARLLIQARVDVLAGGYDARLEAGLGPDTLFESPALVGEERPELGLLSPPAASVSELGPDTPSL